VRDEELDWEIYHALQDGKTRTMGDLVGLGYEPAEIEASLRRLEKALLIERIGDAARPLSFQEAILLCEARNDVNSPICFENGVIRARRDGERKG